MRRNIFKYLIVVLLLIAGLYGCWQGWLYIRPKRIELVSGLINKAYDQANQGEAMALWEMDKAFLLGMDYKVYREHKADLLYIMRDQQAEAELLSLEKKGWAGELAWYDLGELYFKKGDDEQAILYWTKISDWENENKKNRVMIGLAEIAGNQGRWEKAGEYLGEVEGEVESEKLKVQSGGGESFKYQVASSKLGEGGNDELGEKRYLLLGEGLGLISGGAFNDNLPSQSGGRQMTNDKKEDERVKGLKGVARQLKVADLLIEMGLPKWSRMVVRELIVDGLESRDAYLVLSKSYLAESNCQKAKEFVDLAYSLDSVSGEVLKMQKEVGECGGE